MKNILHMKMSRQLSAFPK